jgi:hypothetical protein
MRFASSPPLPLPLPLRLPLPLLWLPASPSCKPYESISRGTAPLSSSTTLRFVARSHLDPVRSDTPTSSSHLPWLGLGERDLDFPGRTVISGGCERSGVRDARFGGPIGRWRRSPCCKWLGKKGFGVGSLAGMTRPAGANLGQPSTAHRAHRVQPILVQRQRERGKALNGN